MEYPRRARQTDVIRMGCIVASLIAAVALAFANATRGPFVFDDTATIVENETIRHFATAFAPPADRGLPVSGRPLVNVSFAVNYAIGGFDPRGYHLGNILLHAIAALTLFGLLRRTLGRAAMPAWIRHAATPLSWCIAIAWSIHPLTTAAVAYISQRAEILVACWYLLTLYGFARSLDSTHPQRWLVVSAAACWCGMATKEVMASAPLVVLLYDRTFGASRFGDAWRARRWFYCALAGSWLLLGWLMFKTGGRAGTAGLGLGITPFAYAVKQCEALVHYLRLAVWPAPLVFDYGGMRLVGNPWSVAPQAVAIMALLSATVWSLYTRPVLGFAGAVAFAILAPTSSFIPIADTMFEHRMYLPLAVVLGLAGSAGYAALSSRRGQYLLLAIIPLALLTARRNDDYRSEISLWSDTVRKQPDNVRAHYTLGTAFAAAGNSSAALDEYRQALRLNPNSPEANNDLANTLAQQGDLAAAASYYETALRLKPSAEAHNNLGNVLLRMRQLPAAREHYEAALKLRPTLADAHNNLGNLLAQQGELQLATQHYQAALQARPDLPDAHANLANVLAQSGQLEPAIAEYEAALRYRPNFPVAQFNLATTFMQLRRWAEAVAHYEATLKLAPNYPGARQALERARMSREVFESKRD